MSSAGGTEQRQVAIWDLPTRLFHWSLVLLVGCNLFFVSPRGSWQTPVHFIAGFCIAGLLLFRMLWGFIGSPRSRFADFLRPWPAVKAYVARLARLNPPHSIGHNPLGGWMIALLLATLFAMILTGVFAAGRRAAGPFAHLLAPSLSHALGQIHGFISNLLIGLLALHVAGVLTDWLLTRENLVMAMITGRKRLSAEQAASERHLAPAWRALIIGLAALALTAGLILATNFAAP
jgi:cytochrome b